MSTETTRLEDVDYYLPLYDEDDDLDPEAHYHRTQLAQGRDFAQDFTLTGISDYAAHMVRSTFPGIQDAAGITDELRQAMIDLGEAIDQANPEDSKSEDRIDAAIADIRDQITTR